MKEITIYMLVMMLLAGSLSAFIDEGDEKQEQILEKLDALKNIQGVMVTGRGKGVFEAGLGSDNYFTNQSRARDYNHFLQMDVNFLAVPTKNFEMGGTLRLQNDLSGFWGLRGDDIYPRDLYAELILLRFVNLRVGQLYEKFNPLTLWAPIDALPIRSELLYEYHKEDLYDNFLDMHDNFPLLGARLRADFNIEGIGSSTLKGIASKIGEGADGISPDIYDRYLFGAQADLRYQKSMKAAGAWTSLRDIEDSGMPVNVYPMQIDVISGTIEYDAAPMLFTEKSIFKHVGVEADFAKSTYNDTIILNNILVGTNLSTVTNIRDVDGMANNIAVYIQADKIKIKAGYRLIDYEFISPGAQTRMIKSPGHGTTFEESGAEPFLYEFNYQNSPVISKDYYDGLNFTYPMNKATPNRKGIFSELTANLGMLALGAEIDILQEVKPIGTDNDENRSFNRMLGYISSKLGKGFEISGFYMNESVKRNDDVDTDWINETENLVVDGLGAELVFRFFEKLSLIGVYQTYLISGRKIMDIYASQEPLYISSYMLMDDQPDIGKIVAGLDIQNNLIGLGFIYAFNKALRLQTDYLMKTYINKKNEALNYNINTMRMLLTAKF